MLPKVCNTKRIMIKLNSNNDVKFNESQIFTSFTSYYIIILSIAQLMISKYGNVNID